MSIKHLLTMNVFMATTFLKNSDLEVYQDSLTHVNGSEYRRLVEEALKVDQYQYIRADGQRNIDILISRLKTVLYEGKYSFAS